MANGLTFEILNIILRVFYPCWDLKNDRFFHLFVMFLKKNCFEIAVAGPMLNQSMSICCVSWVCFLKVVPYLLLHNIFLFFFVFFHQYNI